MRKPPPDQRERPEAEAPLPKRVRAEAGAAPPAHRQAPVAFWLSGMGRGERGAEDITLNLHALVPTAVEAARLGPLQYYVLGAHFESPVHRNPVEVLFSSQRGFSPPVGEYLRSSEGLLIFHPERGGDQLTDTPHAIQNITAALSSGGSPCIPYSPFLRSSSGQMHSKVSMALSADFATLQISSANLTYAGVYETTDLSVVKCVGRKGPRARPPLHRPRRRCSSTSKR